MAANLQDLSVQGIGILTGCRLAPGTLIRVQFRTAQRTATHELPAEIRHATEQADGRWLIGCLLLRLLNVDEALGFR